MEAGPLELITRVLINSSLQSVYPEQVLRALKWEQAGSMEENFKMDGVSILIPKHLSVAAYGKILSFGLNKPMHILNLRFLSPPRQKHFWVGRQGNEEIIEYSKSLGLAGDLALVFGNSSKGAGI